MTEKIKCFDKEEGLKVLEDLKSGCRAADYTYSTVTDLEEHEVSIPAIMLRETLGNKEEFIGRAVTTTWRAMSINAFESYLFLYLQFEGKGEIVFNITMGELGMSTWLHKVVETGAIIICDKSGEFDIGITDIPIDIPVMQLSINQLRAAQKHVGG